jgi:DNA-binding MarR family transcriptional regulator
MKLEDEIKTNFRNDYHKGLVNLYYTNSIIGEQFHALLKKYKITSQQFNILHILRGQQSKTASMGLLKERMLDKSSDITRIIDRLIDKKLVERKTSKEDRRLVEAKITQLGLDTLAKMDSCEKHMDEILSNLTKKEVKFLNDLLDKIRAKK